MNIGVLTSGFFHLLFGILLLINIEDFLIHKKEVMQSVKVALISETDYAKLISKEKLQKSEPIKIEKPNFVNPGDVKKPSKIVKEKKIVPLGNELAGFTEPNISKVQRRKTPGEIITGIAQREEEGTNHSENIRVSAKKKTLRG